MYDTDDHPFAHRLWADPRERLLELGRLSHLVFVDGRLVDAWSEDVRGTAYDDVARRHDEERRPRVVESPAEPPRHERVLDWLDTLVGGRSALLALTPEGLPVPSLRDSLDPVADEPWLVVDEMLRDVTESVLTPELADPLRACLLVLRDLHPAAVVRATPERVAAALVWVVGKANGTFSPLGPVTQREVSELLGSAALGTCKGLALSHVVRLGVGSARPWGLGLPDLLATGRPELLCPRVRADLVRLRDEALAAVVRDV